MKPKRHTILLEAMEPISHGDTLTGVDNPSNLRLFMRSGGRVNGVPVRIPDISENAIRSVMFRYPLHDHLLATLGVERADLPQGVVNLLFSGGNLSRGAAAPSSEIALGHQVRDLYPSLALLGGAVDSFVLPRSKLRLAAWPITEEYAPYLRHVAPELVPEAETVSIFDLLFEETRTRGTGDDSEGNQMLYSYETLAAGTKILVEVTLDAHSSVAVAGSVAAALEAWDGYLGGQARQGRGRMAIGPSELPEAAPYHEHIDAYSDAMLDGLRSGQLGTQRVLCAN